MTPVEEVRRAAALMRERAGKATLGPWEARQYGIESEVWSPTEHIVVLHGGPARRESRYSAEHIASWHPATALAVADWLDATAADMQHDITNATGTDVPTFVEEFYRLALATARAYLAGERP